MFIAFENKDRENIGLIANISKGKTGSSSFYGPFEEKLKVIEKPKSTLKFLHPEKLPPSDQHLRLENEIFKKRIKEQEKLNKEIDKKLADTTLLMQKQEHDKNKIKRVN